MSVVPTAPPPPNASSGALTQHCSSRCWRTSICRHPRAENARARSSGRRWRWWRRDGGGRGYDQGRDEVWSFVGKRDNKQWVWLALDRDTREIVGLYIGDRSAQSAQHLWDSLPLDYRQNALSYTDFWEAYAVVFPTTRHLPVGKETGKTNHIERFNNTLRQRVSRLVRKALSFSKKLENHIGAIWYFVHHYNNSCPSNKPKTLKPSLSF